MANHILRFCLMLIGVASLPRIFFTNTKRLMDPRLFSNPDDLTLEVTDEKAIASILRAPSYCNPCGYPHTQEQGGD